MPRLVLGKTAPVAPSLRRSPIAKVFDPLRRIPTEEELNGLTREELLERLEVEKAYHRDIVEKGFYATAGVFALLVLMLYFGKDIHSFVHTKLPKIWPRS